MSSFEEKTEKIPITIGSDSIDPIGFIELTKQDQEMIIQYGLHLNCGYLKDENSIKFFYPTYLPVRDENLISKQRLREIIEKVRDHTDKEFLHIVNPGDEEKKSLLAIYVTLADLKKELNL